MKDLTIDPPIRITDTFVTTQGNFNGHLHIYLSYDYLPSRNFYLLSKNINELYEYVFEIIHNRPITKSELLVFEEVNTGGSIDIVWKVLEKLNPPKSVWITLGIVSSLMIGHSKYLEGKKMTAETEFTRAQSVKVIAESDLIKSQSEKTKAETEKIQLENEKLKLENELKSQNVSKDYRDKVLLTENLKKINRKLNSIEKQIMNKPINVAIINGTTIYGDNNIKFK